MELYLGWSIFKYIVVSIFFIVVGIVLFKTVDATTEDKILRKNRKILSAKILAGLYAVIFAFSLNTGRSVLNADKSAWNLPKLEEAHETVQERVDNKKRVEDNFNKTTEKLQNSVVQ